MKRTQEFYWQLARKTMIAFLLIGTYGMVYGQSADRRDDRTKDFFGRKESLRRDEGPSRFRLPIVLSRWRTIDGTMNNLVGVRWGKAGATCGEEYPVIMRMESPSRQGPIANRHERSATLSAVRTSPFPMNGSCRLWSGNGGNSWITISC